MFSCIPPKCQGKILWMKNMYKAVKVGTVAILLQTIVTVHKILSTNYLKQARPSGLNKLTSSYKIPLFTTLQI